MKNEVFERLFCLNPNNIKWVMQGGDITKYIDSGLVRIRVEKDEDGKWKSKDDDVTVLSVNNYDPITMTYMIKYRIVGTEEVIEERIIPEGFSIDFIGGGTEKEFNKFMPASLHIACVEEQIFRGRMYELFKNRDTLSLDVLKKNIQTHDGKLSYGVNIQAVSVNNCDSADINDVGFCTFRVGNYKLHHLQKDKWKLHLISQGGCDFYLEISENDKEYKLKLDNGERILKLINPQSEDDDEGEVEVSD